MKTAIDSSVLLVILNQEEGFERWEKALSEAAAAGDLLICPIVFAECSQRFASAAVFLGLLENLGIRYDAIKPEAAWRAGQTFQKYRKQGGPRDTLIPDFLIAAHAGEQADRLAAVDRGYLRTYFPDLDLLTAVAAQR